MTAPSFLKSIALLLAASLSVEAAMLSGLLPLPDSLYHAQHVAAMALLVAAQVLLYRRLKQQSDPAAPAALCFAIGAASTGIGDYVNGALSGVEPVSLKLSWALLLFGIGYSLYVAALWRYAGALLAASGGTAYRWRHALLAVLLPVNVVAWQVQVAPLLQGYDLLLYGSFLFNATLYVMMPAFALWYVWATRASLGAIAVAIGAVWIPFSDLVLFASWLVGNPAVPSRELYACNWILYFGGQALISIFPALLAARRNP